MSDKKESPVINSVAEAFIKKDEFRDQLREDLTGETDILRGELMPDDLAESMGEPPMRALNPAEAIESRQLMTAPLRGSIMDDVISGGALARGAGDALSGVTGGAPGTTATAANINMSNTKRVTDEGRAQSPVGGRRGDLIDAARVELHRLENAFAKNDRDGATNAMRTLSSVVAELENHASVMRR